MAAKYKQTFTTELRVVTASIFLSLIFKCVIKVFSLAQTIIKIKYYVEKYGSMIHVYRSYDTCITPSAFTQKKLDFTEQKICFFTVYYRK